MTRSQKTKTGRRGLPSAPLLPFHLRQGLPMMWNQRLLQAVRKNVEKSFASDGPESVHRAELVLHLHRGAPCAGVTLAL